MIIIISKLFWTGFESDSNNSLQNINTVHFGNFNFCSPLTSLRAATLFLEVCAGCWKETNCRKTAPSRERFCRRRCRRQRQRVTSSGWTTSCGRAASHVRGPGVHGCCARRGVLCMHGSCAQIWRPREQTRSWNAWYHERSPPT